MLHTEASYYTGLSGPAVLKLSAFGARILNSLKYRLGYSRLATLGVCSMSLGVKALIALCRFEIEVNWTGDLTLDEVVELFERERKKNPNR